ncbi:MULTISPECIES: cytochrome C [Chryseobacterium]|uniref:cytochrome C n=1 Tax=Chryseobacterium sp. R2A-55 TaxID=2744445 RepID=UPI001F1A6358|nr:cytochrome C [Chryseobacterium sp. R2A-55]
MKILAVAAILGSTFIVSCTPKTPAAAGTKTISAEYLSQGKTIFENSCKKCHDLPQPTDHSAQAWVGIMNSMAPKAKLNEEQHQMVYDYVVSVK